MVHGNGQRCRRGAESVLRSIRPTPRRLVQQILRCRGANLKLDPCPVRDVGLPSQLFHVSSGWNRQRRRYVRLFKPAIVNVSEIVSFAEMNPEGGKPGASLKAIAVFGAP